LRLGSSSRCEHGNSTCCYSERLGDLNGGRTTARSTYPRHPLNELKPRPARGVKRHCSRMHSKVIFAIELASSRDTFNLIHFREAPLMKRVLIAFVLGAISLVAIPAQAQSTYAKEAEIRAAVPYATMRAKVPGLTLADYNRAVRAVAEQELGIPSTPLAPTAPYSGTSTRIAGTT